MNKVLILSFLILIIEFQYNMKENYIELPYTPICIPNPMKLYHIPC